MALFSRAASGCWLPLLLLAMCCTCWAKDPDLKTCLSSYYSWPRCDDTPFGYECICGPGFRWNTHLCVSTAVDSRLDFSETNPIRYTLLLDMPFPELYTFTVTLWIKVPDAARLTTIFSYKDSRNKDTNEESENFFRLYLHKKTIHVTLCKSTFDTNVAVANNTWLHFALSWNGRRGGLWTAFANGKRVSQSAGLASRQCVRSSLYSYIPSGGEFVLGQRYKKVATNIDYFDGSVAFIGSIAHVNLWDYVMPDDDIMNVYEDCTFSHCGNAVTWVEFRAGTRGPMRLKWPSGIQLTPCFSEGRAEFTCDRYCSHVHGVQCKEQTKENMVWARAPANTSVSLPCPGHSLDGDQPVPMADRSCTKTPQYEGVWDEPEFDECISTSLLHIKKKIQTTVKSIHDGDHLLLQFVEDLHNLTSYQNFTNPMDISTVIDCLGLIVRAQKAALNDFSWLDTFAHNYPTKKQSVRFSELFFHILDMIIDKGQETGWNNTKPPGEEGDEFIKVMEHAAQLTVSSLLYHIERNDIALSEADFRRNFKNSVIKVRVLKVKEFVGVPFPSKHDAEVLDMSDDEGSVILPEDALDSNMGKMNMSDDDYIGISTVRYSGFTLKLPSHDVDSSSQEDNINSVLFGVYVHTNKMQVEDLSAPISIVFNFTNTFNISNPECVRLQHGNSSSIWSWKRVESSLNDTSKLHAHCLYDSPGLFAITTDMYDVDWNKGEKPLQLMTIPTYVGCSISAILCLITLIMLLYLRTSSPTAALHKNFSLALVCCHLTFMIGITQIQDELVCHVFAVLFHYFFLTQFTWLMNEALNLYIVITYTAHSHGQDTGAGTSKYRYYIIGWALPGVLVGAITGSSAENYYAKDMCWIAWDQIWMFLGPPMGIVCVTVLVLTFTAKEQNESAYAKDETANKVLQNHTRGMWTQVILLSVLWTFAFISLKMRGNIMKYLFALFNVLQSSFFLVFYFLLNEEVRGIYRNRRIRKNLAMQGYELSASREGLTQSRDSLSDEHSDDEHTDGGNEPLVRRGKGRQNKKDRKVDTRVHSLDNLSDSDGVRQTAV